MKAKAVKLSADIAASVAGAEKNEVDQEELDFNEEDFDDLMEEVEEQKDEENDEEMG